MADFTTQNVYGLPAKTASNVAGSLIGSTGSETFKIDYNELAKAIIENYNSSTLGNSAQSVKSAIDRLSNNATSSSFGLVKTSDAYTSAVSGGTANGAIVPSQNALYNVWNLLNQATTISSQYVNNQDLLDNRFVKYGSSQSCAFEIHRVGNVCTLDGIIKPTEDVAAGAYTIYTVVAIYRPLYRVATICQGSGVNRFMLEINTEGNVKIDRYGTTGSSITWSTGHWLNLHATYITNAPNT